MIEIAVGIMFICTFAVGHAAMVYFGGRYQRAWWPVIFWIIPIVLGIIVQDILLGGY